ncbi:MAG: hypothetical protein WCL18_05245 [bacterium]
MYEKADKIEDAYYEYNKVRLPEVVAEAKKITDKLAELNKKIIKEYKDEGNLRGLAGRYKSR